MTSAATNTTDDISCEVPLLRTVIFAMPDASTVLADLVFIVTECAIESGKFAKLVAFMIVLTFWCGGRLKQVSL